MTRTQALRMAKAGWRRKMLPHQRLAAKMLGGRLMGNGNVQFRMMR